MRGGEVMVTFGGVPLSFDAVLFEFIKANFFTLMLLLGILKILAKYTSWAGDDEIITFLFEFIKNPKGKPAEKEVKEDEITE